MIPAKAVSNLASEAQRDYDAWISTLGLDLRFAQHKRRNSFAYDRMERTIERTSKKLGLAVIDPLSSSGIFSLRATIRALEDAGILLDREIVRHGKRGRKPRRRR